MECDRLPDHPEPRPESGAGDPLGRRGWRPTWLWPTPARPTGRSAVAEGLGARVCRIEWADDFAAACNAALDAATGDWVLLLNPDEEVDPGGRPALAAAAGPAGRVRRPGPRAARTPPGPPRVRDRRVGRPAVPPRPAVRYVGRLHPRFVTPLEELAAARGQTVGHGRRHDPPVRLPVGPDPGEGAVGGAAAGGGVAGPAGAAALPDRTRPESAVPERPAGARGAGRGGRTRCGQARDAPAPPDPMVGQLLEYLLAVSPEQSRSPIGRDEARDLAARWFPDTPPVVWAVAAERFAAGDYRGRGRAASSGWSRWAGPGTTTRPAGSPRTSSARPR